MSNQEDEIVLERVSENEYIIIFKANGKEVARSKKMNKEQAEHELKTLKEQ